MLTFKDYHELTNVKKEDQILSPFYMEPLQNQTLPQSYTVSLQNQTLPPFYMEPLQDQIVNNLSLAPIGDHIALKSVEKEFVGEVAKAATSDEVISKFSEKLGFPKENETESEFVSRGKDILRKILKDTLNRK